MDEASDGVEDGAEFADCNVVGGTGDDQDGRC